MTTAHCADLRTEYQRAPRAIGTASPRFSWSVDHAAIAYEVEVDDASGRPVWRPGRVESAPPYGVAYAGEPLRSDAGYSWRVRTFAADAASAWAESPPDSTATCTACRLSPTTSR